MKHTKQSIISKDGVSYLIPFILITSCFALWGFANDITNPMVKAFSKIFLRWIFCHGFPCRHVHPQILL